MATLKRPYVPKLLVIAECFKFHCCVQVPGETVLAYVAEVRWLTIHYEFCAHLDKALQDRIVCGISSKSAQKRLLTEPDLTFAKAAEIATGMEEAAKNSRMLQSLWTTPRDICQCQRSVRVPETPQTGAIAAGNHRTQDCLMPIAPCMNGILTQEERPVFKITFSLWNIHFCINCCQH